MVSAGREVLLGLSYCDCDCALDRSPAWLLPDASISEGHGKPARCPQSPEHGAQE